MDIQDRKKSLTAEELRQRYNLEDISKNKKAIQMQKDEITKLDTHLEDFVEATTETLEELQDQVDGNITTWFYSGVPTLSNEPAVEWTTTEERNRHLGDLYYDQSTGYAYRFAKQTNQYVWIKLTDSDVTEALRIANEAQDTADNKRRVFTTTPTTPYDVGDLWLNNQDLYVCSTARESGSYVSTDFEIATKYTDDSSLNTFVNVTYTAAMQNLTNQIDGKISTWYYSGVPTLSNQPASQWTTDDEKSKHTGDLYYDRATGYCYMFEYESSTYKWTRIEDSAIIDALAVANAAQDTADNKRRVFVVQPTPPYDIGDIWIKEDTDLYRCKIATVEGGTYSPSHWVLATNYTDDTVALAAQQALNDYKVEVQETYATSADLVTTANSINGTVNETYTYITTVEANLNNQISDITTTTQTSTGENSLYIEDATQTNAIAYNVDGATEQQTYSGKNILDISDITNITGVTNNGDGSIRINGGFGSTSWSLSKPFTLTANTTYTMSLTNTYANAGASAFILRHGSTNVISLPFTNNSISYTPTQDIVVDTLRMYNAGVTYSNYIFSIQLEKSSTATSYEPYVGGVPSPNPDYPQEVKTIPSIINHFSLGEDNLAISTVSVSYNKSELTLNGTTTGTADLFPKIDDVSYSNLRLIGTFKPGTYTFSGKLKSGTITRSSNHFQILLRKANNSNIVAVTQDTVDFNSTFTLTEETKIYARFYCNGSGIAFNNAIIDFQIEEGSVSHEYVPYGYYTRVKVTGKNMFDKDNVISGVFYDLTDGHVVTSNVWSQSDYIRLNGGDVVTLSSGYLEGNNSYEFTEFDSSKQWIKSSQIAFNVSFKTFTLTENTKYVKVGFRNDRANIDIQLEQNPEATTYEPYKENITLIDMSKTNLFTNDETKYYSGTNWGGVLTKINDGIRATVTAAGTYKYGGYLVNADNLLGKTFTISCNSQASASNVGIIRIYWFNGTTVSTEIKGLTATGGTFTIPTTASYSQIAILFYGNYNGTGAVNDYVDYTNIKIYESNNPTPYYELCKIGDYKDTLSIDDSGNVVINKNVGKVVLNGGEGNWQLYETNTNTIRLVNDSLSYLNIKKYISPFSNYFKGYSRNTAIGGIDSQGIAPRDSELGFTIRMPISLATTANSFKTWLSTHNTDVYYALATPETITLANTQIPLYEGINHVTFVDDLSTTTKITYYRNTPLSGTYATQKQLNDVSTEKTQQITQVRNEVQAEITATNATINVINETIDNGVSKVSGTGYTFDSDGLKIEKTDQDVKSLLDNDGLAVSYKNTELLTVRSNGIEAENMTVRKFYVQRPIRMEKTKSITDGTSVGLGFFYVGE